MCKQALSKLTEAGLKLGINWQKEISELISDIAARDNISCLQVVESSQIQAILNAKNLSSPHKRARIKKELQKQRYPLYFLAKQEFDKQLKALNLSPKIKVRAAPFFEREQLKIEYQCEDQQKIKQIEADIKKLKEAYLIKKAIDYAENRVHT